MEELIKLMIQHQSRLETRVEELTRFVHDVHVSQTAMMNDNKHAEDLRKDLNSKMNAMDESIKAIESKLNKAAGALVVITSSVTIFIQYLIGKFKGTS